MRAEYSSGSGVDIIGRPSKGGCTPKRWIVGIVTVLLLGAIIGVVVYFAVIYKVRFSTARWKEKPAKDDLYIASS